MVATDGIFEVCNRREQEFGIEALEALVSEHAAKPLPELAQVILNTVRGYGRQADDQTLLLVRRL
jgi:serine phosphatase RsbU (regulator of sigma subunit)